MTFSSAGRVGPIRFALVAIAAWVALRGGVWAFERGETATYVLTGAALGLVLAWFAAEAARRLHDTGWRGGWGLAIMVAATAPLVAIMPTTPAYQSRWLMRALQILVLLVAAVLLLRPGARGANRFGEPPAGPLAHMPGPGGPRGGRDALWTGASVLGCALLALAIINISNGMRDAHERDVRFEEGHAMTTRNPARLLAAQQLVQRFRAGRNPATSGGRPPTPGQLQAAQLSPEGWTIGRNAFAAQLSARLIGPAEPSQVSTNYCGPAAFLYCLLEDRPDLYAAYAIGLWKYAAFRLGSTEVDIDPTTVASMGKIQRAARRGAQSISELDWMTMASLSVSTRPDFVPGGGAAPDDQFKAITYPGVVRGWFASVGSRPVYDCMGQGAVKQNLESFAKLMTYWPSCWIVMQIDSSMITGGNTNTFTNRHWVVVNPRRLLHATPPGGAPVPLGQLKSQFRRRPGLGFGRFRLPSHWDWSHMNSWRTDLTLVTWGTDAHTISTATLGEIEDRFYGGIAFPRIR